MKGGESVRVLYVIDSLAPGGAETSLVEVAPELVRRGVDLHVLSLGSQLDLAHRLEDSGAVLHTGSSEGSRTANIQAVLRAARAIRPDLVHTTLYEADIAGRVGARLLGVPSSTSLVNDSYGRSHYAESSTLKLHAARGLDGVTARFARRFHAITTAIAESVAPRIGVPVEKVEVIPRGRDPRSYPFRTAEQRASVRAELELPLDVPVVLAVGRLEPQKGLKHLLDALPAIAANNTGLVTLIAGKDGRAAASLMGQAASSHLDVRFLGHRTDVANLLAAADVFCFPSEREGFGGVLIEAMAVGCPIVASSIPTSVEVLGGDSEARILTAVGDQADLSRAINKVLSSPDQGSSMANKARIRFESRYTIDRVAEAMVNFFEQASTHR